MDIVCYKCNVCDRVVPAGHSRLAWTILRSNGQIAGEVPVCAFCKKQLDEGVALPSLRQAMRSDKSVTLPARFLVKPKPPDRPVLLLGKQARRLK